MTRTATSPILHLIRRGAQDRRLKDLPDHELLGCFLTGQDKGAFDALLRRHGSMVLNVCRSLLRNVRKWPSESEGVVFVEHEATLLGCWNGSHKSPSIGDLTLFLIHHFPPFSPLLPSSLPPTLPHALTRTKPPLRV
jgi:hypothetical protein